MVPGAWAPTLAALLVTWRLEGRDGVWRLLRRLLRWRVGARWYVVAVAGTALVALASVALTLLLGGAAPTLGEVAARFGLPAEGAVLLFPLLPLIFLTTLFMSGPIAEELGWRGFAQTRLQPGLGPLKAGLVIGIVWGLWHLPLFFVLPAATGDLPLGFFLPLVSAWGVLFGGLYARTGGSVLLSILAHAGVNFGIGALGLVTLGGSLLLALFTGLTWLVVLGVWLNCALARKLSARAAPALLKS